MVTNTHHVCQAMFHRNNPMEGVHLFTQAPAGAEPYASSSNELIHRVAQSEATILITGETGVGKGVLARMLHTYSQHAAGPFVTTSCPALPSELLESEMFGHERGAFTGAHQTRIGRIEEAAGGTLFLDEIGDLPLILQPKLLNVLQERRFHQVGGSQILEAKVRIIAATNANLYEKVAQKLFRADLFYRLNVIPLHVPPLRERTAEIPQLCRSIIARIIKSDPERKIQISDEGILALQSHSWPGNVRELENVLERVIAFLEGNTILPTHLPDELQAAACAPAPTIPRRTPHHLRIGGMRLKQLEEYAILQTLEICAGNKAEAARKLGITEKTIYNKMTRYGLR